MYRCIGTGVCLEIKVNLRCCVLVIVHLVIETESLTCLELCVG